MAKVHHMVDMTMTDEEKAEKRIEDMMPTDPSIPDVPWGLRICLTDRELEKLNLEDDNIEVGDYIHIFAMAKVTSFTATDDGTGRTCRVELALTAIEAEDEDMEGPDEADG